jgi:hypothetical protein
LFVGARHPPGVCGQAMLALPAAATYRSPKIGEV